MAFGIDDIVGAGLRIIDKVIPDPVARERAKVELLKQQQAGELDEIKASLAAIIAEAQSADPWTSRARPTFLYIMYSVIILAFVGGVIGIWAPAHVDRAAANIGKLLAAIPDSLWWLFGAGYLGYTGARSFDKWRGGAR
ncbi:MAG: holin family protein [Gemmatimonas sp.]